MVNREGRPFAGMFTVLARPVRTNNNNSNMYGGWVPGQQQRTLNTSATRFSAAGAKNRLDASFIHHG